MPARRSCRVAVFALLLAEMAVAAPPQIELTFDASVSDTPYTGRVFIMTSTGRGAPRYGPDWFRPQPFFALDVKDWQPGTPLRINPERLLAFPAPLAELPAGTRKFQAVIDLNRWSHEVVNAPGNGYSAVRELEWDPQNPPALRLRITRRVPEPELKDSERIQYVKLKSRLLSDFYGHDVFLRAAVGLPVDYAAETARRYPAIYEIPGFGGSVRMASFFLGTDQYATAGLDIIRVFLDPDCPTGHHVFANSANNGPWGDALVEEFIPYLEKRYRIIADSGARYVTGHSSGGWSSLWLQVAYPDVFGGVWSLAPDPVDFSAFQLVDIYAPGANMYTLPDGKPAAVSRDEGLGVILTRRMCAMETVLGRGGQLQSFEAVFSPRGPDGQPVKLWDRATGRIDPAVAKAWRKYDIRLVLEHNWQALGPKLAGKLHIICGDKDTFYLDRAVIQLRGVLKKLGSDAQVVIVPGATHALSPQVHQQVAEQVAERYAAFEVAGR